MTTTCANVVTRAARLIGITNAGQVASGTDAADLMVYLQSVIDRLPLYQKGEWTDVILTSSAAYTAKDGERIYKNGYTPTITKPTTYEDTYGNTLLMPDLSRVHIIGTGYYIWSSDNQSWAKADDLALSDDIPFANRDVAGLVAMTALAAANEYGADLDPITIGQATSAMNSFRARFYREVNVPADISLLKLSYGFNNPWRTL